MPGSSIFIFKEVRAVKFTVKNVLVMFVFVIVAILVAKMIGQKVPLIGQFTEKI